MRVVEHERSEERSLTRAKVTLEVPVVDGVVADNGGVEPDRSSQRDLGNEVEGRSLRNLRAELTSRPPR
jgi:hypothetical protein